MYFAPQRRALFRHLNLQKWSEPLVFLTFWLGNVLRATTACTCSTSQLPKVVRTWCVLYILTSKCASRHNGVHFFDIWTSKSGPRMVCFVHFDLEMCFAPQRRALFRHRHVQKCSDHGVFCTFWLGNVLRATTACNSSSLIWPAGSAPAALASLLLDPPEPQTIGKTQCFATFLPFLASASSYSFSSTLLSSNLSLLSASSLLCFSSVHIVGSLTSKLPSIRQFGCAGDGRHAAFSPTPQENLGKATYWAILYIALYPTVHFCFRTSLFAHCCSQYMLTLMITVFCTTLVCYSLQFVTCFHVEDMQCLSLQRICPDAKARQRLLRLYGEGFQIVDREHATKIPRCECFLCVCWNLICWLYPSLI